MPTQSPDEEPNTTKATAVSASAVRRLVRVMSVFAIMLVALGYALRWESKSKASQARIDAGTTASVGTSNQEASRLMLRARHLLVLHNIDSARMAAVVARQALEIDSSFARAYLELGMAQGTLASYPGMNTDSLVALALSSEDRAIDRDTLLAEAWAARGQFMLNSYHWEETERYLRHALSLDNKLAAVHLSLCQLLNFMGRSANAIEECRTSSDLNSENDSAWATYAWVLFQSHQDSLANEIVSRKPMSDSTTSKTRFTKALIQLHRKEMDAAVRTVDGDTSSKPMDVGMRGYVRSMANQRDKALASIIELEARAKSETTAIPSIGLIYLGLGDYDRAVDYFVRGAKLRLLSFNIGSLASPQFDPIRANPRYPELLKIMKLDRQPVASLPARR